MRISDEDELRRLLARIRRRWFAASALAAGGRVAACAALPLLAATLALWLLTPSGSLLVIGAIAGLGASIGAALLAGRARARQPDDRRIARFIEERAALDGSAPGLDDALVSAVEIIETPARGTGPFDHLLVARAIDRLRTIPPAAVVSHESMRLGALKALAGGALLAVAAAVAVPHLQRAAGTVWIALFPHTVRITVLTGDVRLPAGRPLQIAATLEGRGAKWLPSPPSLVVSAGGEQRTVAMIPSSGSFGYTVDSVDRNFEYHVTAGGAVSASHVVTALFPPRVTRIDLRYRYPSFTGLPARDEEDGGDIYGPAGTTVSVVVHTDKPIAGGSLALGGGDPVALSPAGATSLSADLVLARDDGYRVRLVDEDGLQSPGEIEYFIRIMNDRPPDVRITRPSADRGITPLQEVVIEARADDDYGVAAFDLVYTVAGREPRTVPFARVTGTAVARTGTYRLEAENLQVQPGDVITYYARARDVPRGRRSVEARSDIFFLEVKPFNEEFASAASQDMGAGGSGTQIDGLIAAQKEIISATWNLQRRSGAGRSAQDLKAIAEAQIALQARTTQLRAASRGGWRGGFVPQRVQSLVPRSRTGGGSDHVGAAAEAMGRAADALDRQRTADALPHEMVALQALLRAQAEVRRRQVLQQSAGAGGGSSRSDRDLSTLFDRELQRQQRTAYETPPAPARDEPAPPDDLADRVRDLARRQEDLARRQRALADAARPPEETKRQLARLAREQEELQQRMDELAASARRAAGPGRARDGRAEEAAGARGMREATDAVRTATEEVQHLDAERAAASGQRAADALRQAERLMRGGSADARRRAAGELQIEAQQVAGAQRRIAAEVARLAQGDDTVASRSGDARQRLAAEKDRLADRVDAIERGARDLARETPGDEGTSFASAAGHLQAEQVGARMRAGAQAMRGASTPGMPDARAEQQVARALDAVVEKLGGGSEAAVREATGELDRTRELRDQLSRLEARMRDAEARMRETTSDRSAGRASGGRRGRGAGSGNGTGAANQGAAERELQQARDAYARGLEQAREALGRPHGGLAGSTPEHHEFSRSAPGTEAFKQDFTEWEVLRKDVDLAIEQYETAIVGGLRTRTADDRLSAGGSDRVPDAYRAAVSRYFESIARVQK